MCPTNLNRPIVEKGCIYNLSFVCVCLKGPFSKSKPKCDLENGSRSPKSNQFLSLSQQYSCTSLVLFVLRFYGPVNPIGSSVVSLPNHTFTGQA